MAKKNEYSFKCFYTYEDGHSVPWEEVPQEEKRAINRTWVERWERLCETEFHKDPESYKLAALAITEEDIKKYYELFPERYEADKKAGKIITVETNRQFGVAN